MQDLYHLYNLQRAFIDVSGSEAGPFLQDILTINIEELGAGQLGYAMLLSHQGRIQFDFFIFREDNSYLIDCTIDKADALINRLTLYRMRRDVKFTRREDISLSLSSDAGFNDPRHTALPKRDYTGSGTNSPDMWKNYHKARIQAGIIEVDIDFKGEDVTPHDLGFDLLNLLDFHKGCYIGQEVVSRMEHKAKIKSRPACVTSQDGTTIKAEKGTRIEADGILIATLGTPIDDQALCLARLDRMNKAIEDGLTITLDDIPVNLQLPDWVHS